jgi:predicted small metal-binding protein
MAERIACGDVVQGCQFTAEADTEEELLRAVQAHAAAEHGVKEITPELAAEVKAAIRTC